MNLIEGLQEQISRCQGIQADCLEIGDGGRFLYKMLANSIHEAQQSIATADTVGMVRAMRDLEGYSE